MKKEHEELIQDFQEVLEDLEKGNVKIRKMSNLEVDEFKEKRRKMLEKQQLEAEEIEAKVDEFNWRTGNYMEIDRYYIIRSNAGAKMMASHIKEMKKLRKELKSLEIEASVLLINQDQFESSLQDEELEAICMLQNRLFETTASLERKLYKYEVENGRDSDFLYDVEITVNNSSLTDEEIQEYMEVGLVGDFEDENNQIEINKVENGKVSLTWKAFGPHEIDIILYYVLDEGSFGRYKKTLRKGIKNYEK